MPEAEPYPNAPIIEAILDVRAVPGGGETIESLSAFVNAVKSSYPKIRKIGKMTAHFQANLASPDSPNLTTDAKSEQDGFMCLSEDEKQIVQVRLNGFTFSRLKPYDRWSTFKAEAYRLWATFREVSKVTKINRMALRTVNRLDIPNPIGELKRWLKTVPEIASELPQQTIGYFMQLQQAYPAANAVCVINEATVPSETEDMAIILDVDLFREGDLPQDDESLWTTFDELRKLKDEIFEKSITDETRRLFH